jgi:hypothetical protein
MILSSQKSAMSDGMPDLLINARIPYIYKKTRNFIFNESINEGVFPDLLKVKKSDLYIKEETNKKQVTIDLFWFYQYTTDWYHLHLNLKY